MISCISQKQSGREGVWEKLTLLLVLVRYINSLKWEHKKCIHIQYYCSWIRCIHVILQVLLHHKKLFLNVSAFYKYLPYYGTHYIQKCELYSVKVWQWRLQTRASMAARWRRWQRRGPCTKTGGSWWGITSWPSTTRACDASPTHRPASYCAGPRSWATLISGGWSWRPWLLQWRVFVPCIIDLSVVFWHWQHSLWVISFFKHIYCFIYSTLICIIIHFVWLLMKTKVLNSDARQSLYNAHVNSMLHISACYSLCADCVCVSNVR